VRNLSRRVRRTRRGDFQVRLPESERAILRSTAAQLREILPSEDPWVRRLFPPAYADDPAGEEEYQGLVHDDLVQQRLRSLDVLEETLDRDRLDEDQLVAWMGSINDIRLVLGTRLDVTEDDRGDEVPDDHPEAQLQAVYHYLGWLEEQIVESLAEGLPT